MPQKFRPLRSPSRSKETSQVTPVVANLEEGNVIERAINKIKMKIKNGEINFKTLLWGFLAVMLFSVLMIIVHLYRSQAHNESFFSLMEQYETASRLPAGVTRNNEYQRIASEANKLCEVFWKTRDSYNGCLLQAAALAAAGNPDKGKEVLEKFYQKYGARYLGPFSLFYAAYASEAAGDFAKAATLYKEIEVILKAIEREDLALFHQGRALYLLGKYEDADALFKKIIDNYPSSAYAEAARQYRLLISAAQVTP